MALFFSREGDILTVREELYSFFDTKVKFVRYNLKTWHSQVNNDPWRQMVPNSIAWVKTHYLPKLKGASQ